ncbi:MAG: methyltransferase domain-containing protein [Planctomycetes bacterium]|nr:methyltransferase domain-containing protein [Planctomycetota bacterium]
MQKRTFCRVSLMWLGIIGVAAAAQPIPSPASDQQAAGILEATGIKGGLIVHVGCGDGTLTAALGAGESYLVHGLDSRAANVQRARESIRAQGLYGRVSIVPWEGTRLPYIDNLVNLVIAEDPGDLSLDEVMRVLAPHGVAYVRQEGQWHKSVKPWPEEIDHWTHYRHDAAGNAVAHDQVVGPPRHMQWVGSPRWARHHDHMASLSALVSAHGRIFYIIDEGPKASIQLPPQWVLAARDAFNGTLLWKRPIETWYNHLWPLKSGPALLPRRLVAMGDRVYVTLGIDAPVSEIDAATGKTLRTYAETTTAEEILCSNGLLLLAVNPDYRLVDYREENAHCWTEQKRASSRWGWDERPRRLMALDAAGGQCLWQQTRGIMPLTLAADGQRVVFHDGDAVVCLDQMTGAEKWRNSSVIRAKLVPTGWSPNVVLYDGVVLYSGGGRQLAALAGETGELLWEATLHPSGHFCPEDVLVMDGLVWSGDIASAAAKSTGTFTGRDPHTGEICKEFLPNIDPFAVMHQRCYPSKATDKYLMPSWIGTEFIDPQTQRWQIHHWVRGSCVYGMMPCNGLVYATPHSCACYYQSKLSGFCALAPARPSQEPVRVSEEDRLEKGPAYGKIGASSAQAVGGSWPTYRNDVGRSGRTKEAVPAQLSPAWSSTIGGRLSSLTSDGTRLFVAAIDQHTLHAVDAAKGEKLWHYTAGGRIDSPPTLYQGHVLFGGADGWVYCLRASDGVLAWRFRAAPAERYHVAYEQVESVWPVHGSVLIARGPWPVTRGPDAGSRTAEGDARDTLYCVAGRSMFLDGGLRLLRLDPTTGRKISETILDDKDPGTGKNLQAFIKQKKMPVALPDILSSDGQTIYMRSQRFDLQGQRLKIEPEPQEDQDGYPHLFSPVGLLDDTWFHRAYWIYGKNAGEGWGEWFIPGRRVPTGRILVFDDDHVYGYARDPEYLCNSSVLEYRLFASAKQVPPQRVQELKEAKQGVVDWHARVTELSRAEQSAVDPKWLREHPPLLARAMVLADKTLFVAGPPDVVDERQAWGRYLEPEIRAQLDEQVRALDGRRGALLWAVNAADGAKLAEHKLDAVPVFDGMIAVGGRLYLATMDGRLVCLAAQRKIAGP